MSLIPFLTTLIPTTLMASPIRCRFLCAKGLGNNPIKDFLEVCPFSISIYTLFPRWGHVCNRIELKQSTGSCSLGFLCLFFSDNFETHTHAKLYVAQVSRTATDDVVSFYFLRPVKNVFNVLMSCEVSHFSTTKMAGDLASHHSWLL